MVSIHIFNILSLIFKFSCYNKSFKNFIITINIKKLLWMIAIIPLYLDKQIEILISSLLFVPSHKLWKYIQRIVICINYASPPSAEAYRDRRLTTNFELWVEIFFCADLFPYEDSKTVSVCPSVSPYPEKRRHHSFVNISPTLVIDTSMEKSSWVLYYTMEVQQFEFFSKKFEIQILTCGEELKSS